MKKRLIISVIIVMIFMNIAGSSFTYAEDTLKSWRVKCISNIEGNSSLLHVSWECYRPPYEELDKITLHWVVRKDKLLSNNEKTIFMLPGTWEAGGWSNIKDDELNTILYLAKNGYDVFTMDYRTSNIEDMEYDQLINQDIDISTTADWNYGVYREDIKACVEKIKLISGVNRMFMSGFSRGGTLMYIYASKYQEDLKGLISMDGGIKKLASNGPQMNEEIYNAMIALFKAGKLINPQDGTKVPWIFDVDTEYYDSWKLAEILPYTENMVGQSLPKDFDDISDFVADDVDKLWGPRVLANYSGGNIDKYPLVKSVNEFSRYHPSIQTLEDIQMAAYDDVPYFDYDDNDIDLPAIAFVTNLTCPGGPDVYKDFPNMTINEDVTIKYLPDYGHMDIMFGNKSFSDIKKPLLNWLNDHVATLRTKFNIKYNESQRDNGLLEDILEAFDDGLF